MIVYHGSEKILEHPYYMGGKKYNDYGYGFYCTEYPDIGREWAVTTEHDGYLNVYDFDTDGLRVLNLNEYHILTWLAILLQNRIFSVDTAFANEGKKYLTEVFGVNYESYDVIEGYRADDSYFSFAQDFINNVISLEQLKKAMHLGDLGNQIVLKSKRAYERLEFIDAEFVDKNLWLSKRMARDERARKSYFEMNRSSYVKNAVYITTIIDKEMKADDPRIQ